MARETYGVLIDELLMTIIGNTALSCPKKRFTGTLYPDRGFSIGSIPREQKLKSEQKYDCDFKSQLDSYDTEEIIYGKRVLHRHEIFTGLKNYDRFIEGPESSQNPKTYGSKGITKYGIRVVRNSALLLERKYGKSRLAFGTATVPNYRSDVLRLVAGRWGEITRRFFEELSRELNRRGHKLNYVSVTEIQEKRFHSTGCAVPHLHWIYVCRDKRSSEFYIHSDKVRRIWERTLKNALRDVSDRELRQGIEYNACIDTSTIRTSAVAYIGKYMSKGVKVVNAMIEKGWSEFPKQWWSACVAVKKMFKDSLVRLDSKTCEAFFYGLEHYLHEGVIEWASFVSVEINGRDRTMGLVGTLSKEAYSAIT